jgi:hypothetical protein
MLRIRIVTAAALVLSLGVAGAAAQTAGAPGQPLPLLQIAQRKAKAKLRRRPLAASRFAKREGIKAEAIEMKAMRRARAERALAERRLAERNRRRLEARRHASQAVAEARIDRRDLARTRGVAVEARRPAAPAAAIAPTGNNVWPAPDRAVPGEIAAAAAPPGPAIATEPVLDTDPDEIAAGGHVLPPAVSSNAASPIGLASNREAIAATGALPGMASGVQAAAPASANSAKSAPKAPVVRAMVAAAAANNPDPVGSSAWIAHVLAALGGAIAAGAVAWFLIGAAPRRNYG